MIEIISLISFTAAIIINYDARSIGQRKSFAFFASFLGLFFNVLGLLIWFFVVKPDLIKKRADGK